MKLVNLDFEKLEERISPGGLMLPVIPPIVVGGGGGGDCGCGSDGSKPSKPSKASDCE